MWKMFASTQFRASSTPLHFTAGRFGTHRFKAEARSGPMLAHKFPDPCSVDVLKLNKHFASSGFADGAGRDFDLPASPDTPTTQGL